jgi:uncharacterized protein DUF3455
MLGLGLISVLSVTTSALPTTSHAISSPFEQREYLRVPLNGLPPPTSNTSVPLFLRYIAIGIGHQNYTCSSTNATPVNIGATAHLFNIEHILKDDPPLMIPLLPPLTLQFAHLTESVVPATYGGSKDFERPYPFPLSAIPLFKTIRPIGEHFFDFPANLPTFNLHSASPRARIEGAKQASVLAPATASKGVNGQGAVPWLMLGKTENPSNHGGLRRVYRVETAGGSAAATCEGVSVEEVIIVPYTAEYWFYGDEREASNEDRDE